MPPIDPEVISSSSDDKSLPRFGVQISDPEHWLKDKKSDHAYAYIDSSPVPGGTGFEEIGRVVLGPTREAVRKFFNDALAGNPLGTGSGTCQCGIGDVYLVDAAGNQVAKTEQPVTFVVPNFQADNTGQLITTRLAFAVHTESLNLGDRITGERILNSMYGETRASTRLKFL